MNKLGFYRKFEDLHRGSRNEIKDRLRVYLPFVTPLTQLYEDCQVIDLGCGRGEWLELLGEQGFAGLGVDLDEGMLAACRERGLSVENKDAVAALRELPDASQLIVSGFHFAEHIPFEVLQELVSESLRVLKPAGLLILETPNPENIITGTCNFYLDPTHQRPLPPMLLKFLPEYAGFWQTKILRLQEPPSLIKAEQIKLIDVLGGVSLDYAIVAQKVSTKACLDRFADVFASEYGLTLANLAERREVGFNQKFTIMDATAQQADATAQQADTMAQQANATAQQADTMAQQAKATAQQADAMAQQAVTTVQQADTKAQQAVITAQQAVTTAQQADARVQQAVATAQQISSELHALYNSRSWRITQPLRAAMTILRWFSILPKRLLKRVVLVLITFILRHPRLNIKLSSWLKRIRPNLYLQIKLLSIHNGICTTSSNSTTEKITPSATKADRVSPQSEQTDKRLSANLIDNPKNLSDYSMRSREIYSKLKDEASKDRKL